MRTGRWRSLGVAVAVLLLAAGCSADAPETARPTPAAIGPLKPSEPFGLTAVTLRSPDNAVALSIPVYDAYEPAARQRGLMERERLPARTGMVFRFASKERGGFWMRNTLIPLSIAYFDADGTVLATMDMPPCEADPCPSYDPEVTYRGALEVNRGFFDDIGLEPGWTVELPFGLPPAA